MPPRGRLVMRKASITSNSTTRKDAANVGTSNQAVKNKPQPKKSSMPPPPSPVATTILGPEMQTLDKSLKEAAVNTGRIFRFYADSRKERIASHVPYPPRSMTRTLGRSLERYDQICDTVETHLLHAISVLERDLKDEQDRINAEASASVATRTRSKRPSVSPTATRMPLPNTSPPPPGSEQLLLTESPTSTTTSSQFPPPSGASAISLTSRRPSAILSSLHRPSFPLKLDLSPAALAGGTIDTSTMGQPMDVNVDLGLTSLPSPVTLAPKTARALPNDSSIPDIFGVGGSQGMPNSVPDGSGPSESGPISGNVGMKSTVPVQESIIDLTGPESSRNGNTQLGDSADKPIELDLEANYDDMDIFGDVQTSADPANAANTTSQSSIVTVTSTPLDVDMEGLFTPQDNQSNSFQLDETMGQSDNAGAAPDPDILASLGDNTGDNGNSAEISSLLPGGNGRSVNNDGHNLSGHVSGDSFSGLGSGAETQFDLSSIDLSSFSGLFDGPGDAGGTQSTVGGEEEMDLMQLLAMDEGQAVNTMGSEGDAG